jgi:hypothetical protein
LTLGRLVRRSGVLLLALAVALVALFWLAREPVERALRARVEREAARWGVRVRMDAVRIGLHPVVRIDGLRAEKPGLWTLTSDSAGLTAGRRLVLGRTRWFGPASLTLDAVPTVWAVVDGSAVELREPARGLAIRWSPGPGGRQVDVHADEVPLGTLVRVGRAGNPLLDAGVMGGAIRFASTAGATTFDVDVQGRDVRLAAFSEDAAENAAPAFGEATAVQSRFSGSWDPAGRTLDLPRWRVATSGATLSGSLTVADLSGDPRLDLALVVERVDFAQLLEMSALEPPRAVAPADAAQPGSLGSASLSARVSGRLSDPASFTVTQRLDFTPPERPLHALERLRGAFVHEVAVAGGVKTIDVSPASPDFVALSEVPVLLLETLLLAEDAGFLGHRGVDLSEVPSAVLTNWSRGGAARGASTITQQLAKNLFLSREKRLGRKLQELSLALLLEATLDKQRILEIYLNVIEWGPGLHGLRPAARRYFAREPRDLTPRQMAFLVAIIPGPVKYQRSFASGTLSPGFRPLVDNLLAKLRSVDALTEEEYYSALAEETYVLPAAAAAASVVPHRSGPSPTDEAEGRRHPRVTRVF